MGMVEGWYWSMQNNHNYHHSQIYQKNFSCQYCNFYINMLCKRHHLKDQFATNRH